MRVFSRLSDLAAEQGRLLGTSSWLAMTQSRIDLFADATEDHQWIHTDPERTQIELDQSTIAHGYLTLALIPHFMNEVMRVESATHIINYGADRIRFLNIVPVDARLRGAITLLRADLKNGCLRTTCEIAVEIEGAAKPALVAEVIMLFYE
jgi:acyl dehydratase